MLSHDVTYYVERLFAVCDLSLSCYLSPPHTHTRSVLHCEVNVFLFLVTECIPLPAPSSFRDTVIFSNVCMDLVDYHTLRSSIESPPCNLEVPPTLVCRAFQEFIAKVNSPDAPSASYISIANQLAAIQSFCHTLNERDVCNIIEDILTNTAFCGKCSVGILRFTSPYGKGGTYETDISICDGSLNHVSCVANVEFKTDFDDAARENIGYFIHMRRNKMFLICFYDGHLDVLGAIRMKKEGEDHFVVTPLAESVSFFLHPDDEVRCEKVLFQSAKLLEALAAGIKSLVEECKSCPGEAKELFDILPQVQYDGGIRFHERLGSLVFRGTSQSGKEVVVKFFAEKYGIDVHQHLHSEGLAPEVLCVEKFGDVWSACVMTDVQGKTLFECIHETNSSLTEEVKHKIYEQLRQIQVSLKNNNFVHGDLHSNNIIVTANNKLCVVDFNWAGKHLEVCYPWFLNCRSTKWHNDVKPGINILPEHDNFLIENMIKDLSN